MLANKNVFSSTKNKRGSLGLATLEPSSGIPPPNLSDREPKELGSEE